MTELNESYFILAGLGMMCVTSGVFLAQAHRRVKTLRQLYESTLHELIAEREAHRRLKDDRMELKTIVEDQLARGRLK